MLVNKNFFSKKSTSPKSRFHMDDVQTPQELAEQLQSYLFPYIQRDIVFICIGTDRSTGDSLGPLLGTKLQELNLKKFHVYGTLEYPVHAVNMEERLKEIEALHKRSYIVGIDACLGRMNSVGQITIGRGPVKPGAAVNKTLPEIGDIHLTGIVNIGGMMEYFVLQNTRLHTVMKMANIMAESIHKVDTLFADEVTERTSLLKTITPKIFIRNRKESQEL